MRSGPIIAVDCGMAGGNELPTAGDRSIRPSESRMRGYGCIIIAFVLLFLLLLLGALFWRSAWWSEAGAPVPRGTELLNPDRLNDGIARRHVRRRLEVIMVGDASLLSRIRGEYREMPGLRLTPRQACCLWQLDSATCETVLNSLIDEGFLARTTEGSFVAAPAAKSERFVPPMRGAVGPHA